MNWGRNKSRFWNWQYLKLKRGKDINTQMVTESARFDIYGWNFDFNSSINVEFHDKQLCKNRLLSQRPLSTLKSSIYTFKIDPFYLQWFPVKNDLLKISSTLHNVKISKKSIWFLNLTQAVFKYPKIAPCFFIIVVNKSKKEDLSFVLENTTVVS